MRKKLQDKMEKYPEVAVVAGDILHADGWHQNPMFADAGAWQECVGAVLFPFEVLRNSLGIKQQPSFIGNHSESGYCAKVSGCCFLICMSFLQSIDFFDEQVFLYCEEPILAKQVEKSVRKMYYCADAKAFHNHIATQKGSTFRRMRIFFKSRNYFLTRYGAFRRTKRVLLIFKYWQFGVWCILFGIKNLFDIKKQNNE